MAVVTEDFDQGDFIGFFLGLGIDYGSAEAIKNVCPIFSWVSFCHPTLLYACNPKSGSVALNTWSSGSSLFYLKSGCVEN